MSTGDVAADNLTHEHSALLDELKQEQSYADAHHLHLLERNISPYSSEFHTTHRDAAIRIRNEILAQAPVTVKEAFHMYLMERHKAQQEIMKRLDEVKAELEKVNTDIRRVASARKENWRNYRSRTSHALFALWHQQKTKLEAEQTFLEVMIGEDPIVMLL
jgi:hypothetical protein